MNFAVSLRLSRLSRILGSKLSSLLFGNESHRDRCLDTYIAQNGGIIGYGLRKAHISASSSHINHVFNPLTIEAYRLGGQERRTENKMTQNFIPTRFAPNIHSDSANELSRTILDITHPKPDTWSHLVLVVFSLRGFDRKDPY